jgi:hypothetical protein
MYELDQLDIALRDAIFGYPDITDTERLTLTVPPEVLAALNPQPADDVDELIASVGARWPVQIAGWSTAL